MFFDVYSIKDNKFSTKKTNQWDKFKSSFVTSLTKIGNADETGREYTSSLFAYNR